MERCVARQPIFDRQGKLFAYELLFRDLHTTPFPTIEGVCRWR